MTQDHKTEKDVPSRIEEIRKRAEWISKITMIASNGGELNDMGKFIEACKEDIPYLLNRIAKLEATLKKIANDNLIEYFEADDSTAARIAGNGWQECVVMAREALRESDEP